MNSNEREQRQRKRDRLVMSLLSLLILFSLLGGYFYTRSSQEQVGTLRVIETTNVTISIGEVPAEQPPVAGDTAPAPSPTAAPAASRNGGLVAEVLSANEPASASAAARPDISISGPSNSGSQQAAGATATPAGSSGSSSGTGTGIVPSGGTGSSPNGGSPGVEPTDVPSTAVAGATAVATATAAPAGPTSTPGAANPTSTSAPAATATPRPPTSTPPPAESVRAFGQGRSIVMDHLVQPGAYTNSGILVRNAGPVAFDYSLSMTITGDTTFASVLRFRVFVRSGTSCNYPGQPPAPGATLLPLTGDQVGTTVYDGTFTAGNKFGDPTIEFAAGDRTLDIGETEVLCMEVFFPWTAGNEYQGLTVTGTLIFTAKAPDGT